MTIPLLGDPSTISLTRSMVLCAVGAATGLAIAGYGLFTAAGTTTRTVPPEDVALINQRPILRSDFIAQLEMETGKPLQETSHQDQLKVLDEMVHEELFVQRALELDFGETDQNARNALAAAISDQAIAEVTTSTPSDEELREYFVRNSARYATEGTMSLKDFVLNPGIKLEAAGQYSLQLRQGAAADQLIAEGAFKESSHQIDEYYFTLEYRLGNQLFKAIETLPAGAVSEPLPGKDGVHIVKVERNVRPTPLRFESARTQVASDYMESERSRRMGLTLRFLRGRAKILIPSDYSDYTP